MKPPLFCPQFYFPKVSVPGTCAKKTVRLKAKFLSAALFCRANFTFPAKDQKVRRPIQRRIIFASHGSVFQNLPFSDI